MKITLSDGTEVQVGFMYESGMTRAVVRLGEVEFSAYSIVGPKDAFNKKIGRKIALARALQQIYPSDVEDLQVKYGNKLKRSDFWECLGKDRTVKTDDGGVKVVGKGMKLVGSRKSRLEAIFRRLSNDKKEQLLKEQGLC